MSGQEFDFEILHHILGQFSDHVTRDCSSLIKNLLKPLSETNLNKALDIQDKKAFASVKVLLGLYEKLSRDNDEIESELPVCVILQNIKYILHCNNENCNLPDNDVQFNVLSIVSSLFKNVLLYRSPENLEELAKFYTHILMHLDAKQECKSDCLIFKLKIINSIYHALTQVTFVQNDELFEKMKMLNDLDECELFANLVLHHDDNVAIQTLMYLIPEYVNCFKSNRVFEVIWSQISNSQIHSNNKYFRALIILCNFFDISFDDSKIKNKMDLTVLLLEDINYWRLVQFALIEKDPVTRKQGMFLFKKTMDLLNGADRNFICDIEKKIFYWHVDCKNELQKIYTDIIICLEFLEEQQVHIIKPILGKIETLGEKIIGNDKVNSSWILLLYKKALMHESTQIVKWGLSSLLKLPQFFSEEYIVRETVGLLVGTLNNLSLYYGKDLELIEELSNFSKMLTTSDTSKLFFRSLIKQICSEVWSAEALFFVIHSLFRALQFPCWREEEISEIGVFVSKAFKTHNKTIRTGVQCELLRAISNLTDTKHVPLESLILLISKFCPLELGNLRSQAWDDFTCFLRTSYSKEKIGDVLERYKKQELGPEFNEKFLSLVFILFDNDLYSDSVQNFLHAILLSFREIDKRPYCDKLLYDRYLSVICYMYEANVNDSVHRLVKRTFPFVKNIFMYMQAQLQQISNLQDSNACELYLNSFQIIIKTLISFETHSDDINDLYVEVLKDTEVCLRSSGTSSVGIYWRIKLLSIILGLRSVEPKPSFLDSYLIKRVNEPLRKESDDSSKTRDLQTLWGKLNSEFLEGKWTILECLIRNKLVIRGSFGAEGPPRIRDDALAKLCLESLNTGGYGVLSPVMCILKDLLPALSEDLSETKLVIDSVWKLIMERRKTEEFKVFIKYFVEMLYQEAFALKGEFGQEILFEFADFIFSDSSLAVVHIFMKHVQQINLVNCSAPLFCYVVGKGLIFGPVQKKDEKLISKVCHHIQLLNNCEANNVSNLHTSNEIRARAVQMLLILDKSSSSHQAVGKKLIETLMKMEEEINKNRIRYFGNSHVHRVKHRLMQSLLLLEPMLTPNEDQAKGLWNWLYRCLLTENSQPSIRYMQEWLFVRMSLRHSHFRFSMLNCYNEFGETNKRGLCSAIAVSFHLCKLTPSELLEGRIEREFEEIFCLCFHQHFEIRLYAQVALLHLYDFAQRKKLTKIIENYKYIHLGLTEIFKRNLKGNFGKNLQKLSDDFYFTIFNPVEHYSLETIYKELPEMTNVDLDEWISAETFQGCGVDPTKISIPLKNPDTFFKNSPNGTKWLVEKFNFVGIAALEDEKSEVVLGNYQKKIVPKKPLIPGWDENATGRSNNIEKDGLIVVASLIDRIPNLGGLARTCEVFGASEYVVSSLKHIEDKQFTSLSVTAEKWITVKEVKIQNLLEYISEMKLKGYTIIGAEQMLHSIPLSSAKFPKKSLLLLGNEKEGIPPNFLPLLDTCIEIPQLGIIRSLNVHVTGALFIWEYAKQNNFS